MNDELREILVREAIFYQEDAAFLHRYVQDQLAKAEEHPFIGGHFYVAVKAQESAAHSYAMSRRIMEELQK